MYLSSGTSFLPQANEIYVALHHTLVYSEHLYHSDFFYKEAFRSIELPAAIVRSVLIQMVSVPV